MAQSSNTDTLHPNCSLPVVSSAAILSRGVCVKKYVGLREVLMVGLSVGLVVGRLVRLNSVLSIILSVGICIILNVGNCVGLRVRMSLGRDMVGPGVIRRMEIYQLINLRVNPKISLLTPRPPRSQL